MKDICFDYLDEILHSQGKDCILFNDPNLNLSLTAGQANKIDQVGSIISLDNSFSGIQECKGRC